MQCLQAPFVMVASAALIIELNWLSVCDMT